MSEKRMYEIIDLAISRHNKLIENELKHIHVSLQDLNNKVEKQNGKVAKNENEINQMKIKLITHELKDPNNDRIGALENHKEAESAVKAYIKNAVVSTGVVVAILTTIVTTILSYLLYLRS